MSEEINDYEEDKESAENHIDSNESTETITRVDWELELDNSKVICTQIPLVLAYSLTIHRSQSLSLDSAVLDLADCFCNHMVYVALSRVRSLSGLYLKSFDPVKITVNEKLLHSNNDRSKPKFLRLLWDIVVFRLVAYLC